MKADGSPTKRELELGIARAAGYHGDQRRFFRALVERRTASGQSLWAAYRQGARWRVAGIPCSCRECAA